MTRTEEVLAEIEGEAMRGKATHAPAPLTVGPYIAVPLVTAQAVDVALERPRPAPCFGGGSQN
jgi:hypothetical protein